MKGKIVGLAIFLLLSVAVALTAIDGVSRALDSADAAGAAGMAIARSDAYPNAPKTRDESKLYRTFTYVCPFH